MAWQPSPIFHKMKEVFTRFEDGKLKGQKPTKDSRQSLQKLMEGKYSAKLGHYKTFQGLPICLANYVLLASTHNSV